MSHSQRNMIWSLGMAQCISWGILFYAFSVLLPAMTDDLPLSHSAISFMATLSALIAALVAIPIGRRLDQGRQLTIMMGGTLLGFLGCLIWSLVGSTFGLYTAAIFLGLAQASSLYEPVFVFLLQAFPDEKERSSAMMQVTLLGGLASTVFLPFTTYLITIFAWQGAIRILAMILLIPFLIYKYWDLRLPRAKAPATTPMTSRSLSLDLSFLKGRERKTFLILTLVFLINGLVHTTMTTHLPSALQSWGFSALGASWAVGIMGASQLLGRIGLGTYLRILRQGALLTAPLSLIGLALILLPYLQQSFLPWFLLVVIGSASGLLTLLRPILVSRLFASEVFGRINGILALSYQLARAGGPIGGAWIHDLTQGYHGVFLTLGVMLALGVHGSIFLAGQRAQESSKP